MRNQFAIIFGFILVLFSQSVLASETIVIMRHGEKPANGLGQLNCQGFNRALALPKVLIGKFGKPNYIFAPDTHVQVHEDANHSYSYVRPLATIEPTAIQQGLPVNTPYGYTSDKDIANLLLSAAYHDAVIFVAWEHYYAVNIAQDIFNALNAKIYAPSWPDNDYDSLYVITINWGQSLPTVNFTHDYEKLNNLNTVCPV